MALELWQPDFDFYLAHAEDQLLSIFVDLGALESAPVRSHPRCVHVRVRMQNPLPNGLRARECRRWFWFSIGQRRCRRGGWGLSV